jgi:putrescine---pyruvate transaminase
MLRPAFGLATPGPAEDAIMNIDQRTTHQWQTLDAAHYLHPFTDHSRLRAGGARVIVRGEGAYVWDSDGNRILDGLSGLGNVALGYGRVELANAAAAQMAELSYCQSFFKTTHPAAIRLAEELTRLLPGNSLNHVFFQSSGSEANETAIRAVRRYWELAGRPERRVIIARERAYHGSTAMAASLSGLKPMHGAGGDIPLPNVTHIKAPHYYAHGAGMTPEAFGPVAAGWLDAAVREIGPDEVAAFIAEPAQSAGGAIVPPPGYWAEIQAICRRHDILLLVDEVVCGFGRTGAWFGSDTLGITPDIIQLGKAITSGYAPLSATILSDRVADLLIERGGEWAHGFTYSGHPMCCAVALENISILKDEGVIDRVAAELVPQFRAHVESFAEHPIVGEARSIGLMGGFELARDRDKHEAFPEELQVGEYCSAEALKRGLAFRANGDTMTLMPPLIVTAEQLDFIFAVVRESLDATARKFGAMV